MASVAAVNAGLRGSGTGRIRIPGWRALPERVAAPGHEGRLDAESRPRADEADRPPAVSDDEQADGYQQHAEKQETGYLCPSSNGPGVAHE